MNEEIEELDESQEEFELFEHYRLIVEAGQHRKRLDRYIIDRIPKVSRTKVQAGIEANFILVNGKNVKSSYQINPLDVITISMPTPPRDTDIVAENIPLEFIYEDEHLLVVNKEAGMVVHPAYGHYSGTLVNALVYYFKNLPKMSGNKENRVGLVHRIDKDTSGLLVIAKTDEAMVHLAKQFYNHSIERTYVALVWGDVEKDSATIHGNLGRSAKDRRIVSVLPEDDINGKVAITHYEVLERMRYVSLIQCKLETGRTHQIRAHMKHVGHPLFGDKTYGGDSILRGATFSKYKQFVDNCFKSLPRQALHAKSLGFIHPITKEKVHFEVPLPEDFQGILDKWRNYLSYQ
ncbi:MAG: RluA family pseudouridine synthase [Bacteroidetes bacterium]|nr:MAG: RluA family pseudouridine synthase [Bacteroidota bacterium]